jgi:hypothetical protein
MQPTVTASGPEILRTFRNHSVISDAADQHPNRHGATEPDNIVADRITG